MDKLSYAIGLSVGQNMKGSGISDINLDDFFSGVKTIFSGEDSRIPVEEGNALLREYFDKIQKEREKKQKEETISNLLESERYLQENGKKEGVVTTASGLQYVAKKEGDGKQPGPHSRVTVHYEGRLRNGQIFDSSYQRQKPTTFGLDQVIPGWTEGLQLMKEGGIYEFTVPPQLGYGDVGVPGHIPGNSVLIFRVELIEVN